MQKNVLPLLPPELRRAAEGLDFSTLEELRLRAGRQPGAVFAGRERPLEAPPVTRAQLATILYRMAGSESGLELMLTGVYDETFTDSADVPAYARAAVYWAVYQEIWCGTDSLAAGTTLAPKAPATRAQIAVMITRYLEKFPTE